MTSTTLVAHPFALLIPEMMADELVELERDIQAHGLRQPITLFENQILDGRHRYATCMKLGIEPKVETFTGTEAEAKALVLSLNVHRRHLTLKQKQELIEAELKRDPAQSDRAIGRKAKVDHKTVAKKRAEAAANGEIPHKPAERTEASGRKARGRKPARAKPVQFASHVNAEARKQEYESRERERALQHKLGLELIGAGFKAMASKLHPDKGGSDEAMARLNAVRANLRKHA